MSSEVYVLVRVTSPSEEIDGVALAQHIEKVIPGPTPAISCTAAVVEPNDRPGFIRRDGRIRLCLSTTGQAFARLFPGRGSA